MEKLDNVLPHHSEEHRWYRVTTRYEPKLMDRINLYREFLQRCESTNVPADVAEHIVHFVEVESRELNYSRKAILSEINISRSTYYHWRKRLHEPNCGKPRTSERNQLHPLEKTAIKRIYEQFGRLSCERLAHMMNDQDIMYVSPGTMSKYARFAEQKIQHTRDLGLLLTIPETASTIDEKWIVGRLRIKETPKIHYLVLAVDVYSYTIIDWSLLVARYGYSYEKQETYIKEYMRTFSHNLRKKFRNESVEIEITFDPLTTFKKLYDTCRIAIFYSYFFSKERYVEQADVADDKWENTRWYTGYRFTFPEGELRDAPEPLLFSVDSIDGVITLAIEFYNDYLPQRRLGYFTPRTVYEGKTDAVNAERKRKLNAAKKNRTFDWERLRRILVHSPEPELGEDPAQKELLLLFPVKLSLFLPTGTHRTR